eukprot:1176862-Prorocentrum_minimum.AAC.2
MRTAPAACAGALMSALPTKVPPKKVRKGIMKCPQQMPTRSNAAFGYALKASTPQKPKRRSTFTIHRCATQARTNISNISNVFRPSRISHPSPEGSPGC